MTRAQAKAIVLPLLRVETKNVFDQMDAALGALYAEREVIGRTIDTMMLRGRTRDEAMIDEFTLDEFALSDLHTGSLGEAVRQFQRTHEPRPVVLPMVEIGQDFVERKLTAWEVAKGRVMRKQVRFPRP